jgi:hypothetical protein
MLVAHPRGMFMSGWKGLGRDRDAQPARVAISSTLTPTRPGMKLTPLIVGGLAARYILPEHQTGPCSEAKMAHPFSEEFFAARRKRNKRESDATSRPSV